MKPYYASDRRVYHGTPCSDMRREWNHAGKLMDELRKLDESARCCHFPGEDKYLVFVEKQSTLWPEQTTPKQLTGVMHSDKQEALIESIEFLKKKENV